jgi:uncharacterized protein
VVELSCLLDRRRRNREINANTESRAIAAFEQAIAQRVLEVHPLEDQHVIQARELLIRLATAPLRTLDALHLAVASEIEAAAVATADETLAAAAATLELDVQWFGGARRNGRRRSRSVNNISQTKLAKKDE